MMDNIGQTLPTFAWMAAVGFGLPWIFWLGEKTEQRLWRDLRDVNVSPRFGACLVAAWAALTTLSVSGLYVSAFFWIRENM